MQKAQVGSDSLGGRLKNGVAIPEWDTIHKVSIREGKAVDFVTNFSKKIEQFPSRLITGHSEVL